MIFHAETALLFAAMQHYAHLLGLSPSDCGLQTCLAKPTVSRVRSTPGLSINPVTTTVRNDSWTFETAIGTHGTPRDGTGVWAYSVIIQGRNVAQIGWASAGSAAFEPQEGQGVGDKGDSFGFDGERGRLWAGSDRLSRDYGLRWNRGRRQSVY